MMVEVCAGSAILSKTAYNHGWSVYAIDQPSCRFEPQTPLIFLDLREPQAVQQLTRLNQSQPVDYWHFGLPCGMCSRARERPLPGGAGARPLRGPDALLGYPNLRPGEMAQVQAANAVYESSIELLFLVFVSGALVTIENPARSWLWPLLALLVKRRGPQTFVDWFFALQDYVFDSCMFGAQRQKSTRIKGSPGVFQGLDLPCDSSHDHLGWQPYLVQGSWVYPTKDEAAYPAALCEFLCKAAAKAVLHDARHQAPAHKAAMLMRSAVRAAAAVQTKHYAPLIPEFRACMRLSQVPPGSTYKILALASVAGVKSEAESVGNRAAKRRKGVAGPPPSSALAPDRDPKVGVYHSMEEHMAIAQNLPSPFDDFSALPDQIRRNLFRMLTEGPVAISKLRLQGLQDVNARLKLLQKEEAVLRAKMDPDVESVTRGKAILLFKSLLEETGFPDLSVVQMLEEGVPLVGDEPVSPLFSKRPKPKAFDAQELEAQAPFRRQVLLESRHARDTQDVATLLQESTAEVEAGYLKGPFYAPEDVSQAVGTSAWSLSPRFALRQGEDAKVRVIDDFKTSAVNRAFGSSSYLALQDTDFTVGLLRFMGRVLQGGDKVEVPLSDGTVLEGTLCQEMARKPPLLGKTLDLSKAYKQVGIHPSSRHHAVLGFPVDDGQWRFYTSSSLPFGASASVFSFNKIALALLHIMIHKFLVIGTDFYDDYTVFEFQPGASLLDKVLMRLLTALGWVFAMEGKKFVPFSPTVVSLGVSLNLQAIWNGVIEVGNKPGRLEKIAGMLRAIISSDHTSKSQLASVHGLVNFAGGYILGYQLKPTARMLSLALSKAHPGPQTDLRSSCEVALTSIAMARPRVCRADLSPPLLMYTDGAYEGKEGAWGAIVVDPLHGSRWVFGGMVPRALLNH